MLSCDEEDEFKILRELEEYNASFSNPKAVRETRESRKKAESHAFADDQEFEQQIINKEYKENKYIKAIQKINDLNKDTNKRGIHRDLRSSNERRLPIDLDRLLEK